MMYEVNGKVVESYFTVEDFTGNEYGKFECVEDALEYGENKGFDMISLDMLVARRLDGYNDLNDGEAMVKTVIIEDPEKEPASYEEQVKEDVRTWMQENEDIASDMYDAADYDIDEFKMSLVDELFDDDSVTGNASGSYYFNSAKSFEMLERDDFNTFREAVHEFGISDDEVGRKLLGGDWEYMDVACRCYMLAGAVDEVIDDIRLRTDFFER